MLKGVAGWYRAAAPRGLRSHIYIARVFAREFLRPTRRAHAGAVDPGVGGRWRHARAVARKAGAGSWLADLQGRAGDSAGHREIDQLARSDCFYHLVRKSFGNYVRVRMALAGQRIDSRIEPFDVIIAHELLVSAYAGLRLSMSPHATQLLLDNVEYPALSERSGSALAKLVQDDRLGCEMFEQWLSGLANRYDNVMATSQGQISALRDMGVAAPISLIRNARVATPKVSNDRIRSVASCQPGDFLVLCPNNVFPTSGAEETIRAFAQLPAHFRLCILGEVRIPREQLDGLCRQPGLVGRVVTHDPVPPGELVGFATGADLTIVPLLTSVANHRHCLPNRIFEAIAARNPILAPIGTEIGQFVAEQDIGACFESFEPKDLAHAIEAVAARVKHGDFVEPLERAATHLIWENEQETLKRLLPPRHDKSPRSALIVACKLIDRNDRIYRLTRTLLELDYVVSVVGFSRPFPALCDARVKYLVA